jgi:hypothetical protein
MINNIYVFILILIQDFPDMQLVKDNIDFIMETDEDFQNYTMPNKLYLLQQAIDCSDLGIFTDQINKHIEYNIAKKKRNESEVVIQIIMTN